jgi:very-short-patch-repair endonuclease
MLRNGSRDLTRDHVERVRTLRGEMSVSEKTLWGFLRNEKLGFKFRRQQPVDRFSLDFHCAEAMVNVEVDGEQHDLTQNRDLERDEILAAYGISTLRIPSLDLFEATSGRFNQWLREIKRLCEERSGRFAGNSALD